MKLSLFSQYRGLRKEIYILFFGRVVTNLGSMIWPMMTMILSQKLGLSAAMISYVMVGAGVIMIPANLLGGKIADRYSKKWVIVVCDCVSIFCYLICAAIPLNYVSILLMLLAGICQSMEFPSYHALIAELSTTEDRDRAYSLQYLGGNLGLVLSPTISGLLFRDHLWLAFLLSGVSIAVSTVLIALRVRDIHPEKDGSEASVYQTAQENVPLREILRRNRVLWLYLIGSALYMAAYEQYTFLLPLEMGRVHGESGAVIFGSVSSLNCIVVVIFTPIITRLLFRVREPGRMLCGQGLIAAGYLLFLLLMGHIPFYYFAMLLFTWGEICSTIAEGPYVSRRIPASHRGRISGLSSVLGFLIRSAVSLSIGRIYDDAGATPTWMFVLCVLAAAFLLILLLRRQDRRVYPKLYR